MNRLEQEAKEFLAKKDKISKEKVITDIKTVITYLESIQIKLKDIMNNLSK